MSKNSLSRSRITELLVALQPYRGMHYSVAIHSIGSSVLPMPRYKDFEELKRLGYLELDESARFSFTPKAYTQLQS